MTYTEKELEKINNDYSFNGLDFTKLNKDNLYLIKAKLNIGFSKDDVIKYCQGLKDALSDNGIENVIICPIQEDVLDLELFKLEKDNQ